MTPERAALIRTAFRLEWLTAAWLIIEAGGALAAGLAAHSLTLVAFGTDSVIELMSAAVLLWRLNLELRRGEEFSEATERLAARLGALLLILLAVYVAVSAGWALWHGEGQEFSILGIVIAVLAIPVMLRLASAKRRIAAEIESAALRADAAESIACAYLSVIVVIGLCLQWLTGTWWIDGIAALALIPFLLREAMEAWEAE